MKASTAFMNRVMLLLSSTGRTVWRNNTAQGWAGKSIELRAGDVYKARGGERVVFDAFPIKAGLCKGASDIIGLESVVVTSEMVGSTLAVFGAWEVKTGTGQLTPEQKTFLNFVRAAGGIAEVVRTEQDAMNSRLV